MCKSRGKPTKESTGKATKLVERFQKEGGKIHGLYWTLGRYDTIVIFEAKDEKAAMKLCLAVSNTDSTETLVAVPRDEALKLLE